MFVMQPPEVRQAARELIATRARARAVHARRLRRVARSVFINRTGEYEYESYEFANHSREILELFAGVCDRVGVEYRIYARQIRIYRRASVARMLEHVDRKL